MNSTCQVEVRRLFSDNSEVYKSTLTFDELAVESPLEIAIKVDDQDEEVVSVTLRTPEANDSDIELSIGFLLSEGVLSKEDNAPGYFLNGARQQTPQRTLVRLNSKNGDISPPFELKHLKRNVFTSSACGACGKTSIESLGLKSNSSFENSAEIRINPDMFFSITSELKSKQKAFSSTGGIHAAAVFSLTGQLVEVREDVGRHNAVDKLIGWAYLKKQDLRRMVLLVSGRLSFELVQKAQRAGISTIASIGAPSSLAIKYAIEHRMTVVGFLKKDRLNIYCGSERILSCLNSPWSESLVKKT